MTGELAPGQTWRVVVVESLTRTQIVQYAGASGDFNPVHIDEPYATGVAGQPSVFAHGMLTMGLTGRALNEIFGSQRLASFGGRFLRQVWPGDTLTVTVTVADERPTRCPQLNVTTANQNGELVFSGSARLAGPPANASPDDP